MSRNRIRELREARGKTVTQLADETGLSRPAISRQEKGSRKPSLDSLNILADYFNVSIDYLVGREWPTKKRTLLEQRTLRVIKIDDLLTLQF